MVERVENGLGQDAVELGLACEGQVQVRGPNEQTVGRHGADTPECGMAHLARHLLLVNVKPSADALAEHVLSVN